MTKLPGTQTSLPPEISVLIPVCRNAALLPRALESLRAQTHPRFEVVVINDASPDNAGEVLAEHMRKDPRIHAVVHEKNQGTLTARLNGLDAAKGRYVMCLDADDTLDPDAMEKLLALAEREHADIVAFGARLLQENPAKDRYARTIDATRRTLEGKAVFEEMFLRHAYNWSVCLKLIRRELFQRAAAEIPREYCVAAEDFYLYTAISFFAEKLAADGRIYYNYFIQPGICNAKDIDFSAFQRFATLFTALNGVRDFLRKQGVFEKYREAFLDREREHFLYLFERWPFRVVPEDRAKCLAFMLERYDRAQVEKYVREYFAFAPGFAEKLLSGENPPFPEPPKPRASVPEQLFSPLRFLLPTESPQWFFAKKFSDAVKQMRRK
ncbi:MAG: putative glycosyltransferase EpsJ [Lentisphaerae bacterium ADurb.Bin242]|nr:MAG: putative glycosyltransferase EpsJ [Lentisphaerae bacterium ADurb.Bin242]